MLMLLVGMVSAATLQTASHHGVWTGISMEWRSEILLSGADTITLALPLPPEVTLLEDSDGSPIRDEHGQIIGFDLPLRKSSLLLRQPLSGTDALVTLRPPLVESDRAQRVTLEGIDFHPDDALGMESRVRCATHPEFSVDERQQIDEQISGRSARIQEQPIYLIADDRLSAGLVGSIRDERRISMGFAAAAGGVFLGLLSLLAVAYRGLERRARVEQMDAYLKQEFINRPAP